MNASGVRTNIFICFFLCYITSILCVEFFFKREILYGKVVGNFNKTFCIPVKISFFQSTYNPSCGGSSLKLPGLSGTNNSVDFWPLDPYRQPTPGILPIPPKPNNIDCGVFAREIYNKLSIFSTKPFDEILNDNFQKSSLEWNKKNFANIIDILSKIIGFKDPLNTSNVTQIDNDISHKEEFSLYKLISLLIRSFCYSPPNSNITNYENVIQCMYTIFSSKFDISSPSMNFSKPINASGNIRIYDSFYHLLSNLYALFEKVSDSNLFLKQYFPILISLRASLEGCRMFHFFTKESCINGYFNAKSSNIAMIGDDTPFVTFVRVFHNEFSITNYQTMSEYFNINKSNIWYTQYPSFIKQMNLINNFCTKSTMTFIKCIEETSKSMNSEIIVRLTNGGFPVKANFSNSTQAILAIKNSCITSIFRSDKFRSSYFFMSHAANCIIILVMTVLLLAFFVESTYLTFLACTGLIISLVVTVLIYLGKTNFMDKVLSKQPLEDCETDTLCLISNNFLWFMILYYMALISTICLLILSFYIYFFQMNRNSTIRSNN